MSTRTRLVAHAALLAFAEAGGGFFLAVENHAAGHAEETAHAGAGSHFQARQEQGCDIEQQGNQPAEGGGGFSGPAQGSQLGSTAVGPLTQQHHNGCNDDECRDADGGAGGSGHGFTTEAFAGAGRSLEYAGEKGFQELRLGGRNVVVFLAAQPEDESGQRHEDAGNAECPAVAPVLAHPGNDQEREEGTQVDGPVKGSVQAGHGGAVLFLGRYLVANEG